MNKEIKEIIIDLIERYYAVKSASFATAGERNAFEAEMIDIYNDLDYKIGALEQKTLEAYEEEIEDLEENLKIVENDNADLIDRNYALAQENMRLWQRINDISKVVNDTWS